MFKRLSCLFMALIIMITPLAAVNVSASAASDAANGIVRVYAYSSDTGRASIGSAFGIGTVGEETDLFVTNLHCVTFEDDGGNTVIASRVYIVTDSSSMRTYELRYADYPDYVFGPYNDADTSGMVLCDVIGYIDGLDLAILRASKPISGRVALEIAGRNNTESEISVGETIYALGYPADSDSCVSTTDWSMVDYDSEIEKRTTTYSSLVRDVSSTKGSVSRLTTMTDENNAKTIQIDAEISSGNSGGALINEKGIVVGINTWSSSSSNLNFALYSDYIWQVADTCGVANEINVGVSKVNVGLIVGIAVAAVVIIVLVVVIVVLATKGKKNKNQQQAVVAPTPVPAPNPVPTPAPQPTEKPASGFPEGPRVQCIAGALVGNRYPLTGILRIGRNPQCNEIVIPAGTDGVSGVHCQLELVNGTVYLKDLGSTYGTFVDGAGRLAASQPYALKIGDRFYLGSKKEMFELVKKGGAK